MTAPRENDYFPAEKGNVPLPTQESQYYFPTEGKHYFFPLEEWRPVYTPGWLHPYRIAIVFCAVEFLRNIDRRKLKECPYCQKFFIAKDTKRQRCYSDECKKEYERLRKQKQRGDDPVKYY